MSVTERDTSVYPTLLEGCGLSEAQGRAFDSLRIHGVPPGKVPSLLAEHGLKGSAPTVRRWLADSTLQAAWQRYHVLASEEWRRVLARKCATMVLEGHPKTYIAAHVGISYATLYNYLALPEALAVLGAASNIDGTLNVMLRARALERLLDVDRSAREALESMVDDVVVTAAGAAVEYQRPLTPTEKERLMRVRVAALDAVAKHTAPVAPGLVVNNTAIAAAAAVTDTFSAPTPDDDVIDQDHAARVARTVLLGG